MEGMEYLYELSEKLPRCGPGDDGSTRRAFGYIPKPSDKPYILDIGCGPGMQTLELARISAGKIIALDNHQGFLDELARRSKKEGLEQNIDIKNMSMLEMDFKDRTFDIIWAEGALYCMGFENGLKRCHELLKDGGYMAVTEIVYLVGDVPGPVKEFFGAEYPDIKDVGDNIELIQKQDFSLISNFTLPHSSWFDNYYSPVERELPTLMEKYKDNKVALDIFEGFKAEIDFYRKYSKFYGYEFFIMRKSTT
ncbi:MAG: class I SAM-dependent methyltransferase [bacterium]